MNWMKKKKEISHVPVWATGYDEYYFFPSKIWANTMEEKKLGATMNVQTSFLLTMFPIAI